MLGYNCWRAASGEEVAVLQGGWGSDGHRAYSREMLMRILGMAQKGAQYAAEQALPLMPLDLGLTQPTLPKPPAAADMHVFTDAGSSSDPLPASAPSAAPTAAPAVAPLVTRKRSASAATLPGSVTVIHHSGNNGRTWKTYKFNGAVYNSLPSVLKAVDSASSFLSSLSNYSVVS